MGFFSGKKKWQVLGCMCIVVICLLCTAQQTKDTMFFMLDAKIVLDAGHGGWDPGKTGSNGKDEKELNLAVTEKLAEYLEQGGCTVIQTRRTDEALGSGKRADLSERRRMINESEADILISIHQNAFPSPKAQGAQVFYHASSDKGRLLAECVQESLRLRVNQENQRQAKENSTYYILRTTELPAVLVECGFLSNRQEEQLLNDAAYQERLAWAIYCGILDYFQKSGII